MTARIHQFPKRAGMAPSDSPADHAAPALSIRTAGDVIRVSACYVAVACFWALLIVLIVSGGTP